MSTMPPFYEKLILWIYTYATVRSYLDDLLEVLDVPDVLRAVDPALQAWWQSSGHRLSVM